MRDDRLPPDSAIAFTPHPTETVSAASADVGRVRRRHRVEVDDSGLR